MSNRQAAVLSVEHVWKSFGATVALRDVSLRITPGEVHALLGHNGSGKSTLIKILSGYHSPDRGRVVLNGAEVHYPISALDLARRGVGFLHQDIGLVPSLSVLENIRVTRFSTGALGRIRWAAERERVRELLESFGLGIDPEQQVSELSAAQRAVVGILRAVQDLGGTKRGMIVLDEPTAALPAGEAELLFEIVRTVASEGLAVLFVTHHLHEPLRVAKRVSVLRDGSLVASEATEAVSEDDLAELVSGRVGAGHAPARPRKASAGAGEVVLEARGLVGEELKGADVTLQRGEVLGLIGPMGAGHQEVPFVLYGAIPRKSGTILLQGSAFEPTPARCRAAGIAFVSGDRARAGGIPTASVQENLSLPLLDRLTGPAGWIRRRREAQLIEELITKFGIVAEPSAPFAALSGGNQQKALIARWLVSYPQILLLQEPTAGVDIGSVRDITAMIRDFAAAGGSVVWASEQEEDLARAADRVVVFIDGQNNVEIAGERLNERELVREARRQARPAPAGG